MTTDRAPFSKLELKLRKLYQAQDKLPKLIDDDQFEAQSLREYYIKLRVVARGDEGGEAVTMRELFSRRDGRPAGRVLITGGAGLGKSTLLQYVAFRWSLEPDIQSGAAAALPSSGTDDGETKGGLWHDQFRRVLRVPLKILSAVEAKLPVRALVELVREGLNAHDVYDPRGDLYFEDSEVRELLFDDSDAVRPGTLLLLDGFDEVAQEASRTGSVVRKVLDLVFTEFTHFVVTTRPNAVELLPKSARVEREIENVGLGADGVTKFLNSFFHEKRELGNSLTRFLRANAGVADMCTIPINMALMCIVWTPAMRDRFEARFRLIDLYEEVVLWLGRRYMRRCGRDVNESTLEVDVLETDVMRYLMELAYDGLSHGALRLDKDAMLRAKRKYTALDMKGVYDFGLLRPEGGGRGAERVHLFIHLSFQEYLAALQLLHKLRTEDPSRHIDIGTIPCDAVELPAWAAIEQGRGSGRWLMTLKFLAGLVARETERNDAASATVRTVFWESVSCNRDGVIELGDGPTLLLLMHLLAQGDWDLSKIPNGPLMQNSIDGSISVVNDAAALMASGYLTAPLVRELQRHVTRAAQYSISAADVYFRFRHHPLVKAAQIDHFALFKSLLNERTYSIAFRRLEEHLHGMIDEAAQGDSTSQANLKSLMAAVLHHTMAGLRNGWSVAVANDAIRTATTLFPELLNKALLRSALENNSVAAYIDILLLFPEAEQVSLVKRRSDRFFLPSEDSSDDDDEAAIPGHGLQVREALERLPKIANADVRNAVIRKMNEKMLCVIDVEVIAAAFETVVGASLEAMCNFTDALCNAINVADAADQREQVSAADGWRMIDAYDRTHRDDGVESSESTFEDCDDDGYRMFRCQEALLDRVLDDTTRHQLFPIEHLMFLASPQGHLVLGKVHMTGKGAYRSIKVEIGRCVARCVVAHAIIEVQVATINKLHAAVLGSNAARATGASIAGSTSIGFLMAAVHGLFHLMFEKCPEVSAAAQAAIASIWKETTMLASHPGDEDAVSILQLQDLYVQRTDLGERRQILRLLDEVTSHSLRRGLDAMLDLLTLDDELDTTTAVVILPDVLATAQRLSPNIVTQADREYFLHRLCVISAYFPDYACDVEAAGVAIVQAAASTATTTWKDLLRLSVFGVGADEAVRAAQQLLKAVSNDVLEQEAGDIYATPRGDDDIATRAQIESRRAMQLRSGQLDAISCANLRWTVPEDLKIDVNLTNVHPHYRRTGGAATALRRLWTEKHLASSLLQDVVGALRGTCEADAAQDSPLLLLSWSCGCAAFNEVNHFNEVLRVDKLAQSMFEPEAKYEKKQFTGWDNWADDKHLCPSIGSQVLLSTLSELPNDERHTMFQQVCESIDESSHDISALSTSVKMRTQRLCLEVVVEALLMPEKDDDEDDMRHQAARYVASHHERVSESQVHIAPLTHFVTKRLQRSYRADSVLALLPVLDTVANKEWIFSSKRGSLLARREPRTQTMPLTSYLFGATSPLWSYNEKLRDRAMTTALSLIGSLWDRETVLKVIKHCLFALTSPPNSLHRTIALNVVTQCTRAIRWTPFGKSSDVDRIDAQNMNDICQVITVSQVISPAATKVLVNLFVEAQPRVMLRCLFSGNVPLTALNEISSAAAAVYGQSPEILDAHFGDVHFLSIAGNVLDHLATKTDRDSKDLEMILVNFFERAMVHIELERDDAWLTPHRAAFLTQNQDVKCGLLLQHHVLEKLRRTLLSRFLADGIVTSDEHAVIKRFIAEADMTVSLTRRGRIVLDETEYVMQGNTVETLAANNRARKIFPRVLTDARTAAADVKCATSLMVAGCTLEVHSGALSLLHDESSATQIVVLERRTIFGDVVVQTVDRDLRIGERRILHPLANSVACENMRRELVWEALYGGSLDGKFREHTWWHFVLASTEQDACLDALQASVEMRSRLLPSGVERSAPLDTIRLDLLERVRQFVGAAAFETASLSTCRIRATAVDVLRPTDPALRMELQLHAMGRRLHATEGAVANLREGLTKLDVSVADVSRTIDALTAAMPDLERLPRLLERDRDEQVRAAEVRCLEESEYSRGVYHELRSQLNGVYVAAQAVMSGIVANSKTGTVGVVGSVLSTISSSIPIIGSAVGCVGAMLSAVDAVQQEERLRRYVRVAPSSVVMDGIAEHIARRIALMGIAPAELRATLSKSEIVSETLGELKRVAMRYFEPPTTVASTDESRGRQDGAQLCALIVVKLQEGEALPSSTDEVCETIITFIQMNFERSPSHTKPESATQVTLCPPDTQQRQAMGISDANSTADRSAVETPSGGGCCHMM
jgi:hypothetical protein